MSFAPFVALDCADPGEQSSDNADAAGAILDYPQLQLLQAPIRRRKAFASATGQGMALDEYTPRDLKACAETAALAAAIYGSK